MRTRNPASPRRQRAKSPTTAAALRSGDIVTVFGKKRRRGNDRRFIVSIASNIGGGRQQIYARNPKEAAAKATINAFAIERPGLRKKSLSIIVTDLSKKRNAQTFF